MTRVAAAEAAGILFKALSAPLRISIVSAVDAQGPLCVHELVESTDASQSLISQHLRVPRAANVVRGTRRGKEVAYEIADEHVAHIVRDALSHVEEKESP